MPPLHTQNIIHETNRPSLHIQSTFNEKVIQDFSSTRCIDPKTHVIEAKEIMASKLTITWSV